MTKINSIKRFALTPMLSAALLLGVSSFADAQNPDKAQRKQEKAQRQQQDQQAQQQRKSEKQQRQQQNAGKKGEQRRGRPA